MIFDRISGFFGKNEEIRYAKEFANGYHDFLYPAFNTLDRLDEKMVRQFAGECRKIIDGKSFNEIRGELLRLRKPQYGYDYSLQHETLELKRIQNYSGEDYPYILAVGTFHYNGYFREKCVKEISDHPQFLPFAFNLLNDWVTQVRRGAERSVCKMMSAADIFTIAVIYKEFDLMEKRGRFDKTFLFDMRRKAAERITVGLDVPTAARLCKISEEKERRRVFSALFRDKLPSLETAEYIFSNENKNVESILELYCISRYELSKEQLIDFTENCHPKVRAAAADKLYELFGLWDGAENLLLDKTKAVRQRMQYYFEKKSALDIKKFYRDNFPIPAAIKGFGECGKYEDERYVKPFADSPDDKIAEAAVYALANLTGDGNDDLYYNLLLDSRKQTAKAAYRAFLLVGNAQPERVYSDIKANLENELLVRRLVRILCRCSISPWYAMPYLIRLYNAEEEYIYAPVRRAVDERSRFLTISGALAYSIKTALGESELPSELADDIMKQIN